MIRPSEADLRSTLAGTCSWLRCPMTSSSGSCPSSNSSICHVPTELDGPNEEIEHVYFPIAGMASIVAEGEDGESVDTTMVGREGMTGLAVFLGTGQMPVRTMVQLPLKAVRMRSAERCGRSSSGAAPWSASFPATRRSSW